GEGEGVAGVEFAGDDCVGGGEAGRGGFGAVDAERGCRGAGVADCVGGPDREVVGVAGGERGRGQRVGPVRGAGRGDPVLVRRGEGGAGQVEAGAGPLEADLDGGDAADGVGGGAADVAGGGDAAGVEGGVVVGAAGCREGRGDAGGGCVDGPGAPLQVAGVAGLVDGSYV